MKTIIESIQECRKKFIESSGGKLPTEIKMSTKFFNKLVDEIFAHSDVLVSEKNTRKRIEFAESENPMIFNLNIIKEDLSPILNFYIS